MTNLLPNLISSILGSSWSHKKIELAAIQKFINELVESELNISILFQ